MVAPASLAAAMTWIITPTTWRRRSGALPSAPRRKPGGKSGDHQCGPTADGKTATNPGGLPKEVIDWFQAQLAANRAQFYYDVAVGPFYGYNRPGAKPSQGVIWNWGRQGMMGGTKAHCDGIVAFSQTDFTEDLKKITLPVLVMHGDDDQIVPYADSAPLSAKLLKNSTLKTYKGFPHGMPTTEADTINADLLTFLKV